MTDPRLRVGVFGAGPMGLNHLNALARRDDVAIAGVADQDAARALAASARFGVPSIESAALAAGIDAAVIAVSSRAHAELGLALLSRGVPCLIEKPLAMTEAECLALMAAAEGAGATLAVGHIERWNPAVAAARELLKGQTIRAIDARRLNAASARVTDSDVVIDLMIHDLDIVLDLMGEAPVETVARGRSMGRSGALDHATALLTFANGCVASVSASRVTPLRARDVRVLTDEALFVIDCLKRQLQRHRPDGERGWAEAEDVPIQPHDALGAEQAAFLAAVAAGRRDGGVSARAALATLRVVWAVQAEAGR